ncbi:unnamed protein product [Owenia fusiformis]|uniref:Uncharacterized protein n=1 Tax=Owenia fusiformis TaxID=6347 RepID=A0A8J1UIM6_OWEFU|nr:unnamed protein product [Owenia fusiformis]
MAGRNIAPGKRRKRNQPPPVYNGVSSSYEDKDNDFVCPICFEMMEEAYMTKCGHSFCHKCIKLSLEQNNRCPKCNFNVEKSDQIFPNFALTELILKHRQRNAEKKINIQPHLQQNGSILPDLSDGIDLNSVDHMLELLIQKKQQLEEDTTAIHNQIMKEFLQQVRLKKKAQLEDLQRDMEIIDTDLRKVESYIAEQRRANPHLDLHLPNGIEPSLSGGVGTDQGQTGFNGSKTVGRQWLNKTMASRRKRVHQHFDDLEQWYFDLRQKEINNSKNTSKELDIVSPNSEKTIDNESAWPSSSHDGLGEFTDNLSKFIRFNSCRPLATLNYASDIYNTSSIVSSIEFDRDCDFFAIAGVTKKIKVFEYSTVIQDAVDMHYPVGEMVCNSKISCVMWSSYHKNILASSDYEGTVTLWDAFVATKTKTFQEHEKRCWSVDFNRMDPKLIASGSDDAKVKLWSINAEHSIASLEAKANVCCVKFNPESRYHLAFGSADHCVHYYDLRHTKQALTVFKGHRKAVSYTKFANRTELVSASTDSQLKLWNVNSPQCIRTFKGHTNEKNFVGLASDGDYLACGSENNSLYIYYKGLSKHLLTYKFDTVRSVLEKEKKEEDSNEFVSAVCWRPGSNVCVAANSQGVIKVLELI